ncbi:MAG: MFS transporter [Roseibacillus sp.]|nr:MFS transporter [Roseibacillus sp.]
MRREGIVGHRYWIAVVFCLLAAAPGAWLPVLSNVLEARGWNRTITWAFLVGPIAGMISPLLFSARADQRIPAEKLVGIIITGGAIFLCAAFRALEAGSPKLFLIFMMINALISAPAWGLLTAIALNSLEDEQKSFGFYRVWGTIGWVVVGWSVSWFSLDESAKVGDVAFVLRLMAGLCAFLLPHTPPMARDSTGWKSALGLDSLSIFKNRDHRVYLVSTFLLSVPLAAFYMHTPIHLRELGFSSVAAGMTVGQIFEVVAFLMMGFWLQRVRIKILLVVAMSCAVIRYLLFAFAGVVPHYAWLLLGLSLHGICWTFFFETGRVFLNRRVDQRFRAQVQALVTFASMGLGSLVGTLVCGRLYDWMVVGEVGGWTCYWSALAVMCLVTLIYFSMGYRGIRQQVKDG